MKKVILLIVVLIVSIKAFSTVRTVSNNPATLGQFSTIQAAIDASADSDTVYVYGSPNTYAAFTIQDKKITVIGPGWSPDKNLPLTAVIDGAFIRNSPAGGSPDGSEIHGLVFVNIVYLVRNAVGGDLGVNNLRIIRCQFNNSVALQLGATGFLFEGCIFYYQLSFTAAQTYQNILFLNNIFFFAQNISSTITGLTNSVNVRFDHNLFYSNNNSAGASITVFDGSNRFLSFTNNIFNQANVGSVSFSTFSNNITNNITLNSANATSNATPWAINSNVDGGGNVANTTPGMVDQVTINAGNGTPTLNFTIASGAANNSGSDGKDMGLLFDGTGSLNWTNSRNSRVPRIFSMNITTPTVTPGGNLSVTVDARKSN